MDSHEKNSHLRQLQKKQVKITLKDKQKLAKARKAHKAH